MARLHSRTRGGGGCLGQNTREVSDVCFRNENVRIQAMLRDRLESVSHKSNNIGVRLIWDRCVQ